MTKPSRSSIRYYLLIGDPENWRISLSKKLWGFKQNTKGSWNKIEKNDVVVFYVTSPIQRVVGYGHITDKFVDDTLTWKDEILFERSIWRYKIKFDIIAEIEDWKKGIRLPPELVLLPSRKPITESLFNTIQKEIKSLI